MNKITKAEALKLCIELWTILSDRESYDHDGWRGATDEKKAALRVMGYDPEQVLHACFACEYTLQVDTRLGNSEYSERNCTLCPIKAWRSKSSDTVTCLDSDEPYFNWREAETIEDACQYAQQVVRLAQESLDAL